MNVLLSSVGRRSYLVDYFKEALAGKGKVVATNTSADATGMFAADIAEVVPPAKSPKFIDALLETCLRHNIKLLCSLHDWEVPFIAPHKDKFIAHGIIPVLPEPDIVDRCLDKYLTALSFRSIGISSPKCFINLDEALQALKAGSISFPIIVKPRWGQGSLAVKKVFNEDELCKAYYLINSELDECGIDYLIGYQKSHQVLIQQFLYGKEFGVDIVNDLDGNFAACFVKYKFAMRFGETDAAQTVNMPQIYRICRLIADSTRHPGILDADFILDEQGSAYLLELNPRFGGGYPFSHMAGANVPAALIAWREGSSIEPAWLEPEIGVRSYKDIRMVKA